MSYHKLLVGLVDPETAPRIMAVASALAKEHVAHLIALHVVPPYVTRESGQPTEKLVARLRAIYEEYRDDDAFSSEWRLVDDDTLSPGGTLVELGNACDALILGQRHGNEAGRSAWHLGEHVVGVTARPVMLVPEGAGDASKFAAQRVLVAWDGSSVATRAAFDALPLLQKASSVRIHRFNPPPAERTHVSGTSELFGAALARHGVPVELSHGDASRFAIGEEILAIGDQFSADLVVMGCQVHSRVREFLLGGTTRHVFANARCPVLLGG